MNAEQAYPHCPSYTVRALATFEPGELVTVGPAYEMGGTYRHDGCGAGRTFRVIRELPASAGSGRDYYLTADLHPDVSESDWDLIVHPSRLVQVNR